MCQNIAVETKVCSLYTKVENILTGSLDSIPSPSSSVNIPIIARKVYLRCKGKTLLRKYVN